MHSLLQNQIPFGLSFCRLAGWRLGSALAFMAATLAVHEATAQEPVLQVGNLVFLDVNENGRADAGEGVDGVVVRLFAEGQDPLNDPPLAESITAGGGCYLLTAPGPGYYFVFLPPDSFAAGNPLLGGTASLTGTTPGDDDAGENGIDEADPAQTGIRSGRVTLATNAAPLDSNTETGWKAASDNPTDGDVDLTVDFGLSLPPGKVGVGNWLFYDANGNGLGDETEGVDGVPLQLFLAGADPLVDAPVAETTTQGGGAYAFLNLDAGDYFLYVPATAFQSGGRLAGALPLPVSGGDDGTDDSADQNGIDESQPSLFGVRTGVIHLWPNSEPLSPGTETGHLNADDDAEDSSLDYTVDFGFTGPALSLGNSITANLGSGFSPAENVTLLLYRAGDNPASANPVLQSTSTAGGLYQFSPLPPGDFFVHIPPSEFETGASLAGLVSIPGQQTLGLDDDASGDDLPDQDPYAAGISSADVSLRIGAAPTDSTTETGGHAADDNADDANGDLTVDFAFQLPGGLGVGNLVFEDGIPNGVYDDGEGIDAVIVQIFAQGADPSSDAPLAESITSHGGRYRFVGLNPGQYFVHLPAANFALAGSVPFYRSLPSYGMADDDEDEDGLDSPQPWITGISSSVFTLSTGGAPTGAGESGFDAQSDDFADANIDTTIDFALTPTLQPPTFALWVLANPLDGLNEPEDDPDGDCLPNFAEFAFALNPASALDDNNRRPLELLAAAGDSLHAQVRMVSGIEGITYTLEAIADLTQSPAGWFPVEMVPTLANLEDGAQLATYTGLESVPGLDAGRGFIRIRIEADLDGNETLDHTYVSPAFGWHRLPLGVGVQTVGASFSQPALFTATVSANSEHQLDLGTSIGQGDLLTRLSPLASYYAEVQTGPLEGHRYEVKWSGTTQTLLGVDSHHPRSTKTLSVGELAGQKVAVFAHHTLVSIFPHATFHPGSTPTSADSVLMFEPPTEFGTWFLVDVPGEGLRWISPKDSPDSQDGSVIPPCTGLFLRRVAAGPPLLLLGQVRDKKIACPLAQGYSFLGSTVPLPQSPAQRGLNVASGLPGGSDPTTSSGILRWNGDTVGSQESYTSYMLLDGGAPWQFWILIGDNAAQSQDNTAIFEASRAVFLKVPAARPALVLPRAWTP